MTPKQAADQFCRECTGSRFLVKDCGGDKVLITEGTYGECLLHKTRMNRTRFLVGTLRRMCAQCMGQGWNISRARVKIQACTSVRCPLFQFRLGTNPNYHSRAGKTQTKT